MGFKKGFLLSKPKQKKARSKTQQRKRAAVPSENCSDPSVSGGNQLISVHDGRPDLSNQRESRYESDRDNSQRTQIPDSSSNAVVDDKVARFPDNHDNRQSASPPNTADSETIRFKSKASDSNSFFSVRQGESIEKSDDSDIGLREVSSVRRNDAAQEAVPAIDTEDSAQSKSKALTPQEMSLVAKNVSKCLWHLSKSDLHEESAGLLCDEFLANNDRIFSTPAHKQAVIGILLEIIAQRKSKKQHHAVSLGLKLLETSGPTLLIPHLDDTIGTKALGACILLRAWLMARHSLDRRRHFTVLIAGIFPPLVKLVTEKRTNLAQHALNAAFDMLIYFVEHMSCIPQVESTTYVESITDMVCALFRTNILWLKSSVTSSKTSLQRSRKTLSAMVMEDWLHHAENVGLIDGCMVGQLIDNVRIGSLRQTLRPKESNFSYSLILRCLDLALSTTDRARPIVCGVLAWLTANSGNEKKKDESLVDFSCHQPFLSRLCQLLGSSTDPLLECLILALLTHLLEYNLHCETSDRFVNEIVKERMAFSGTDLENDCMEKIGKAWRLTLLVDRSTQPNAMAVVLAAVGKAMFASPERSVPLHLLGGIAGDPSHYQSLQKGTELVVIGVASSALPVANMALKASWEHSDSLFQRLSPLLFLRRLPSYIFRRAWMSSVEGNNMHENSLYREFSSLSMELKKRLLEGEDHHPTPNERRLAAELVGHCLPFGGCGFSIATAFCLPTLAACLEGDLSTMNLRRCNASLYAACYNLTHMEPCSDATDIVLVLLRILSLLDLLGGLANDEIATDMLQLRTGCITFFSQCLDNSAKFSATRASDFDHCATLELSKVGSILRLTLDSGSVPQAVDSEHYSVNFDPSMDVRRRGYVWDAHIMAAQRTANSNQWARTTLPWILHRIEGKKEEADDDDLSSSSKPYELVFQTLDRASEPGLSQSQLQILYEWAQGARPGASCLKLRRLLEAKFSCK